MQRVFTLLVLLTMQGALLKADEPKERMEVLELLPIETISTNVYKAKIFWVKDESSSRMQFVVLVKNIGVKWLQMKYKKENFQLTDDQGKMYEIFEVQSTGYPGQGSTTAFTIDAAAPGTPERTYCLEIRPSAEGIVPLQLKSKYFKLAN